MRIFLALLLSLFVTNLVADAFAVHKEEYEQLVDNEDDSEELEVEFEKEFAETNPEHVFSFSLGFTDALNESLVSSEPPFKKTSTAFTSLPYSPPDFLN